MINTGCVTLRGDDWVSVCCMIYKKCLESAFEGFGIARLAESVPGFGSCDAEGRVLSLDRGKQRSKFDADLRIVDRVGSVETGCRKVEMYELKSRIK